MGLQPLGDQLLVTPDKDEERQLESGIILTGTIANQAVSIGDVVAVGPGARNEIGVRIKPDVVKGDRVYFSRYAGTEVQLDGEKFLLMREADVLARMED